MINIMKQLHRNALEAVRELEEYCAVSETMADAVSEEPIPWDTFYRVKAGQALKALQEFAYNKEAREAPSSSHERLPPNMLDATEISMGHGMVDVAEFKWGTRKGVLLAPRSYFIEPGQPGPLANTDYWPMRGDVVIWIDNPNAGAAIVEELIKL